MRFALLPLLCAAPAFADEAEFKKLAGTYDIKSIMADGERMPAGKGGPDQIVIKDGKFTLMMGGKAMGTFADLTMEIDAKKTPKAIDLIREGKDQLPAVYELKDDELKLAMPLVPLQKKKGELLPRPDSFETKGKEYLVVTAKRKK